nr:MAG TPA: hypothetical protein [Caudoviricetes sp.]
MDCTYGFLVVLLNPCNDKVRLRCLGFNVLSHG